jgi:hypothetical protein
VSDRLPAPAIGLAVLLAAIWGGSYTMVKVGFRGALHGAPARRDLHREQRNPRGE